MRMQCCCWLVCVASLVLAAVASPSLGQPIQDSDVADMPERMRELLLIRRLVSNLNTAELAIPDALPGIRKRTCYINAGLSHGCDYKDLVGAMAEKNYWDSLNSPGRRRRSPQPQLSGYQAFPSIDRSHQPQLSGYQAFPSIDRSQQPQLSGYQAFPSIDRSPQPQ